MPPTKPTNLKGASDLFSQVPRELVLQRLSLLLLNENTPIPLTFSINLSNKKKIKIYTLVNATAQLVGGKKQATAPDRVELDWITRPFCRFVKKNLLNSKTPKRVPVKEGITVLTQALKLTYTDRHRSKSATSPLTQRNRVNLINQGMVVSEVYHQEETLSGLKWCKIETTVNGHIAARLSELYNYWGEQQLISLLKLPLEMLPLDQFELKFTCNLEDLPEINRFSSIKIVLQSLAQEAN